MSASAERDNEGLTSRVIIVLDPLKVIFKVLF